MRSAGDRGTGLIATVAGVTVFLAFLLFSVQLLTDLRATSVVTSAGYEAAHTAATAGRPDDMGTAAARRLGEDRARELLGDFGDEVDFDWSASTADEVVLTVSAVAPRIGFPGLPHDVAFGHIDRTITVRVERVR